MVPLEEVEEVRDGRGTVAVTQYTREILVASRHVLHVQVFRFHDFPSGPDIYEFSWTELIFTFK